MRFAILFPIVLAVSGCAATVSEPTSTARVSSDTWLVMTDEGIGPVRTGAPFQASVMAQVAAGSEIRSVEAAKEGSTTWTQAAFVGGQQAVQFFKGAGNTVGEMHGVSQHLAGPNGERIGMTMAQAGISRSDCRDGTSLWRGMAVCKARGARHITLVFAIPQYAGPFDVLPSAEDLKRAELQRIVWSSEA